MLKWLCDEFDKWKPLGSETPQSSWMHSAGNKLIHRAFREPEMDFILIVITGNNMVLHSLQKCFLIYYVS